LIINSDFPNYSGILYKFNPEIILQIEGNNNETLKEATLVVNFYKRIPFVPEQPEPNKDNRLFYIVIFVGIGIAIILLIIVVCCVLRRAAGKKPNQFEGSLP